MSRSKLPNRTIALAFGLKHYLGRHCPRHPAALFCVRHVLSKHCVLALRESAHRWDHANRARKEDLRRARTAKRKWLRSRYQQGWRKSRETMNTPTWRFFNRAKKFREFLKSTTDI